MLPPLPITGAQLERYRLLCRQQRRPAMLGAHQTRRKGQSLEFRDIVPYVPGDDIRYVDWQASARLGNNNERLVRTFGAEEQLTIAISVDTRDSMRFPRFPVAQTKLIIASWLAEAVALAALQAKSENNRVILHRLFGRGNDGLADLHGRSDIGRIRPWLVRQLNSPSVSGQNISRLIPKLPPAAIWLIISDLYFDDPDRLIAHAVLSAQDGHRWVIITDLNSWPFEKALLERGEADLVAGPDQEQPIPVDTASLDLAQSAILLHKADWLSLIRRDTSELNWEWPGALDKPMDEFFQEHFFANATLKAIFRRDL